jgi:hypothetical protein
MYLKAVVAVAAVAAVAVLGAFGGHSMAGTKTSVVTHTRTVTVTKAVTPASCQRGYDNLSLAYLLTREARGLYYNIAVELYRNGGARTAQEVAQVRKAHRADVHAKKALALARKKTATNAACPLFPLLQAPR